MGKQYGEGAYTYVGGDRYEGAWLDNAKHGQVRRTSHAHKHPRTHIPLQPHAHPHTRPPIHVRDPRDAYGEPPRLSRTHAHAHCVLNDGHVDGHRSPHAPAPRGLTPDAKQPSTRFRASLASCQLIISARQPTGSSPMRHSLTEKNVVLRRRRAHPTIFRGSTARATGQCSRARGAMGASTAASPLRSRAETSKPPRTALFNCERAHACAHARTRTHACREARARKNPASLPQTTHTHTTAKDNTSASTISTIKPVAVARLSARARTKWIYQRRHPSPRRPSLQQQLPASVRRPAPPPRRAETPLCRVPASVSIVYAPDTRPCTSRTSRLALCSGK